MGFVIENALPWNSMHELHLQFPVSGNIHFMPIIADTKICCCVYCPSEPPREKSGHALFEVAMFHPSETLREKLGRAANDVFCGGET